MYAPKFGILVVSVLNGLSKEAFASALPRFWRAIDETGTAGSLCRTHCRSTLVVEEARGAMVRIIGGDV